MRARDRVQRRRWLGSAGIVAAVALTASGLAAWKSTSLRAADATDAGQPEPVESVTAATAKEWTYRETTTSIGTVLAVRSISLRNEVSGTVAEARLTPGRIVSRGELLVALDVSVEEADLQAEQAQEALALTTRERLERLGEDGAASQEEVDRARAEHDVARAQVQRTKAIIGRKTIRAPFRARVGIADVHRGQYLNAGTLLTTLQAVTDTTHVDFEVSQQVATGLHADDTVQVVPGNRDPVRGEVVAVDARVDPTTRNATVRARVVDGSHGLVPGSSVRVEVPVGASKATVIIPASALRKGPEGDHVFVLAPDPEGRVRAHLRPVQAGPMEGDDVVVLEGLEAGEQVAALGSFKLREAALVAIADTSAAPETRGGTR